MSQLLLLLCAWAEVLACPAYSFQTFTVGQVLQASHMNQVEVNVRDHVHGTSSVVNQVVLATEQATTSGTSIDFTGIPAGTRRIVVHGMGISTNGTSDYLIQLGDSGGVETSGYSGRADAEGAGSTTSLSAGFIVHVGPSAAAVHGIRAVIELEDSTNNVWNMSSMSYAGSGQIRYCQGEKGLTAALDRVRLTTANGTDAFDAGAINITYEG